MTYTYDNTQDLGDGVLIGVTVQPVEESSTKSLVEFHLPAFRSESGGEYSEGDTSACIKQKLMVIAHELDLCIKELQLQRIRITNEYNRIDEGRL